VDSHVLDPEGSSGFSSGALFERWLFVSSMARLLGIPVVINVAGGCQSAGAIARLNAQAVHGALRAFA
jgi:hypothetical protein